jgi:hypothetical protein
MASQNVTRDFWVNKNVTDKQVLFDLYHELALLIIPFKRIQPIAYQCRFVQSG